MVLDFIMANKGFVAFVIFLSVLMYLKRDKLEIQGKYPSFYVLMYKTRLGLEKMDKWSKNMPKTFMGLSIFSFLIGVIGIFVSVIFVLWQLYYIVIMDLKQGAGLLLPIQTQSGTIGGIPVIAPPFLEWLLALIVLVVVHEFAHGVIAQRFNIRVKSSGFAVFGSFILIFAFTMISLVLSEGNIFSLGFLISLIFAIIAGFLPLMPAAFVEPDEKQLHKAKWWHQISVYGAGSASNFVFAFLFLFILLFVAMPFVQNTMEVDYVSFNGVMNQSSLYEYNITSGDIIAINGVDISDRPFIVSNVDGTGFSDRVITGFNFSLNQTLNLTIKYNGIEKVYPVETFENPDVEGHAMIGITNVAPSLSTKEKYDYLGTFPLFFQRVVFWIYVLNFGIGIMNLLPLWITDGGQITRTLLLMKFKQEKAMKILNLICYICLFLLVLMLFPQLLKNLVGIFV